MTHSHRNVHKQSEHQSKDMKAPLLDMQHYTHIYMPPSGFCLLAHGSQRKKKKGAPCQPSKHLQNMLCLSKYALPFSVIFREEDMFGLFGGCFESLRLSQFHVTDGAEERRCGCKEKHDLTAAPPHTPHTLQPTTLFEKMISKLLPCI